MAIAKQRRLLVEERRRRILDRLERQEAVTVEDLARGFAVSTVTIRGDLEALSDAGLLVRSHGGALRRLESYPDVPLQVKQTLQQPQKLKIAARAARMVGDNEILVLDSGTTTLEIARQLRRAAPKGLTVITNALNIAVELCAAPQIRVIMLGGLLRHSSQSLVGPHAAQGLHGLSADRAFIGVDGLDVELGLMTPDVLEAELTAVMMEVAREVVIVADSSKFGRRSLSVISKLKREYKIITDDGVSADVRAALKTRKIDVIIA
jgi:DeoR family transcriptional regulator of aga operon